MRITLNRFGSSVMVLDKNLNRAAFMTKYPEGRKLAVVYLPNEDAVYRVNDAGKTRYIVTRKGDHDWHQVDRQQAQKIAAGAKFEDVMGDEIEWTHGPVAKLNLNPQPVRIEDIDMSDLSEDKL